MKADGAQVLPFAHIALSGDESSIHPTELWAHEDSTIYETQLTCPKKATHLFHSCESTKGTHLTMPTVSFCMVVA